jgi:hypothetical protein
VKADAPQASHVLAGRQEDRKTEGQEGVHFSVAGAAAVFFPPTFSTSKEKQERKKVLRCARRREKLSKI